MFNISENNIREYFLAAWPLFRKRGPIGAAIVMLAWASANKQSNIQASLNQVVAIYLLGLAQHCNSAEQAWTVASRYLQSVSTGKVSN